MSEKQSKKKRQLNKYLQLTGISFQIGVTIFLGAYFGKHLDAKYNYSKRWFTISLTLLALIISIYSVIKQLEKINNDN